MASSLTNLLYHIVFSTKERIPLIHEGLEEPLYDYIGGILRGQRSILLEIGGMPDHVHLLVKLKADLAVAAAVRLVKSNSSGWVNENQRFEGVSWQTGYFAVSVSESRVDEVRHYIWTQKENHARIFSRRLGSREANQEAAMRRPAPHRRSMCSASRVAVPQGAHHEAAIRHG